MTAVAPKDKMNEGDVLEYLRKHPDLLVRHPDILAAIVPPGRDLGENIADFQQYQVKNLQASSRALHDKYAGLVDFCRDNLSVQTQVHDAVLRLVRARGLTALLEVLTLDLVSLFDVDVVRLAVESEHITPEDHFNMANLSGIVFVPPGTITDLLEDKKACLVEDSEELELISIKEIFADCEELARSCAVLALDMEGAEHYAALAFGVRYPGRFQPNHGIELLNFLARIVAYQLESHLTDLSV